MHYNTTGICRNEYHIKMIYSTSFRVQVEKLAA